MSVDVVANARALAPEVRKRADEIEEARRLPAELSQRFAEAGLYRTCVPEAYGGLEAPPAETMGSIEAIAQADGSAAWCVFIGTTSGSVLSLLPPDSAREIFHRETVLLGGVFAPRGKAVAEDGGFRVNGRWAWGSGTQNADWVMGGCQVIRDGQPELMKSGAPRSRMMIAPAEEIEFLDTWHVSGLCGTGSTDYVMNDVFVPERRAGGIGVDPEPLEPRRSLGHERPRHQPEVGRKHERPSHVRRRNLARLRHRLDHDPLERAVAHLSNQQTPDELLFRRGGRRVQLPQSLDALSRRARPRDRRELAKRSVHRRELELGLRRGRNAPERLQRGVPDADAALRDRARQVAHDERHLIERGFTEQ